jgi:hypothetical protein
MRLLAGRDNVKELGSIKGTDEAKRDRVHALAVNFDSKYFVIITCT